MNRVLIAEDEPRIAAFLEKGLRAAGYTTRTVATGPEAVAAARDDEVDLLLLDLGLPGIDGLAVLAQLRRRGERMPVIVLTARDGIADRVSGLDLGADDYLGKPFAFDELLARVRARLRQAPAAEVTVLRSGGVVLDLVARTVEVDDRSVELTAREFLLAETFLRNRGQVLSREQLLSRVWGYDHDPGSNVVDVYVGYLRRKIAPGFVRTVRGAGYSVD